MKKMLMVLAMVAVIGLTGVANAAVLNLAGSPWNMSSIGWGLGGNLAIDNNGGTRSSSVAGGLPGTPQWIWVDMGADYRLGTVSVDYQLSSALDYTVRLLPEALAGSENNPAAYTTLGTASALVNHRDPFGVKDTWDFTAGTVSIPSNLPPGTATVDVLDPEGRYLMVHATSTWDVGWGNISIWEIGVNTWEPPPPVIPHAGNEVDLLGWRTTDVPKALDPDGDNIYGTDGWIRPTGEFRPTGGKVDPSYCTVSYIGLGGWYSYSTGQLPSGPGGFLDDALLSGPDPVADVEAGREEKIGTVNDMVQIDVTEDGSFRLGVMTDFIYSYAGAGVEAGPTSVRVRKTIGGNDDSGMIAVPVRNTLADWMFFDIIDAVAGDQFIVSIESFTNPWGWSQISHLSFDTIPAGAPIPEPAGLGLLGVALLAVRRKRS